MRKPKFWQVLIALSVGIVFCFSFSGRRAAAQNPTAPSAAQDAPNAPYLDASLPIEQRVNDLVSRMTLEEKVSQMQDVAPAIPRLGIPAYNWWNEALHGVARAGNATVFPQAIGLAATWDAACWHGVAVGFSTKGAPRNNLASRQGDTGGTFDLPFWWRNF